MPDRTPPSAHDAKPTARQLRYLKALAEERGQSFSYPRTRREASREIDRLRQTAKTARADAARERRQVADDMATRRGDAARVREDVEIAGWGSQATWATGERDR